MTLNEYIDKLIEFRDEEKAGELEVICYKIFNTTRPRKCVFLASNGEGGKAIFNDDKRWQSEDDFQKQVNAICLH